MGMLEVCIDEPAGIEAAVTGGADRIELCAALSVGGLTPPASLVRLAAEAPIPVHLLARPRDGDFCYTAAEAALIAQDISLAAEAGLAGVVIGASAPDRRLDIPLLVELVAHARAAGEARSRRLSLTLHRAVDALPMLAQLHRQADGRIGILPGSGIDASCAPAVLATGVGELHASCRSPGKDAGELERRFGFQTGARLRTDPERVRLLKEIVSPLR